MTAKTLAFIRLMALALISMTLLSFSAAQTTEGTIKEHCAAEWPSDFQMQAFCEGQQRKAVIELNQQISTTGGIPEAAFKTALSGCVNDWPEDYSMQAFCLQQQIKGYNAVSSGRAPAQAQVTAAEQTQITTHCEAEWPTDYQMQAFCEGQQLDGLNFLKNQPASVNAAAWSSTLAACAVTWRTDYQMQAFCVRRDLGL